MELNYNVTGQERKALVNAASTAIGIAPVYKGAPTFAYAVGNFTISRDGIVTYDDRVSTEEAEMLKEALNAAGFKTEEAGHTEEPEATELSVAVPRDSLTEEAIQNIKKIAESKASLFKKAFGADELYLEVDDENVTFPWFKDVTPESVNAYMDFISALCDMARNQKRITAREKEVESEKYAFRCFLLRLGLSGAEHKETRKILLQNLSGNAAFPTQQAADEFAAKQKAKREAGKEVEA